MLWHLGSLYLFAKYRSRVQVIRYKGRKGQRENRKPNAEPLGSRQVYLFLTVLSPCSITVPV